MDDAFALLRLQVEWGADEAIDLDPIDRLRPVEVKTAPTPRLVQAAPAAESLKETPAERALTLAAQATSLNELRDALSGFDGCALRDTASNMVFAEGNPASATLIVGEPPGRDEDRGGHPFAGPEGQLLDQMLASIGLTRGELLLTPLLPWRPPGGRPPSPNEIALCLPFLHRLIALVKPKRIVVFGAVSARALLPATPSRRRGQRGWSDANIPGMRHMLPLMILPGLPEMLKNPPLRRDAWAGLRLLRRTLDET